MTAPRGGGRFDPYGRTVPLPPAVAPRPADPRAFPDDAAQAGAQAGPAAPWPGAARGPLPGGGESPQAGVDPGTGAGLPAAPGARSGVRARRSFWGETWRWVVTFALFGALAAAASGGVLLFAIDRQARLDQAGPADAIVVLGTAQWNGYPGPVLRARLDHALGLYWQGLAPVIVVTGGRMQGDQYTEAEAAQAYLLEAGVPAQAILLENAGRDSWESMQAVSGIARDYGLSRLLLVSDGFHLFRLKLMARDLGLDALASPAPGSPIVPGGPGERAYMVREAGGVVEHLLRRFSFLRAAPDRLRAMFG
ncbi:MAG: YdcF family protein [Chloroflexota bacterium]